MAVERAGLRLNIDGLRFRSGDRVNADWQAGIVKQRLSGTGVLKFRSGDSSADLTRFFGMRQSGAPNVALIESTFVVAVEPQKTAFPEMIDHPKLPFRVAREVVPGSLLKGRTVAAEINEQNPGSKLRIPTEAELLKLNKLLGNQLEGNHLWIWTETEHEDYQEQYVLRHQGIGGRSFDHPEVGCLSSAARFVEDK
jgi:hypothetical protein